jgi:hypothetical protein
LEQIKTVAGDSLFKRLLELSAIVNHNSKEDKEFKDLLKLYKEKTFLQQSRDESIESVSGWNAILQAL